MREILLLKLVDFIFVQLSGDFLGHLVDFVLQRLLDSVKLLGYCIETGGINTRFQGRNG
jgi:hypothetical protein